MGAISNVGLIAAKSYYGYKYGSISLLADAAHGLGDLVSDAVTYFTFKIAQDGKQSTSTLTSQKRKDAMKYPFGRGMFEPVGSVVVSGLLLSASIGIMYHSGHLLLDMLGVLNGGGQSLDVDQQQQSHTHSHTRIDQQALWIALGSIGVKELLFRYSKRVGDQLKSSVIISNAWHHRADALTSLVATIGVGAYTFGYHYIDPLGGMAVAALILKPAVRGIQNGMDEILCKQSKDSLRLRDDVYTFITADGKIQPELLPQKADMRLRKMGPYSILYLDVDAARLKQSNVYSHIRDEIHHKYPEIKEIIINLKQQT
ncbi:hypothetical protein MP228_000968 [Amoeboaphelidium protococcarum]|nr:hypothetical protein MP228_000968 [Amoeboaphelidium protococcarum]